MTTGRRDAKKTVGGRLSPFPVEHSLKYLCMVLRGLEGILRGGSLLLYKNNIIDRKWMNVLMFIVNLLQYVCNNLSVDNKLKDGN